jgi:anti-sigma B factor antagonist
MNEERCMTEEFKCGQFTCGTEWAGDSSAVLVVTGELDMHNSEDVSHELDRLHERGIHDHLIVDMTECAFIDSIGLSVLISAQHRAKSPLNIVVTDQTLRKVLTVTGLASIFTLHETRDEALQELKRRVGAL